MTLRDLRGRSGTFRGLCPSGTMIMDPQRPSGTFKDAQRPPGTIRDIQVDQGPSLKVSEGS